MKKTLVACMVVLALFAIAGSANAITCTVDQRPAATLLVPYFQTTFNADGTQLSSGAGSLDTLVTIGNASSAPMIAHVNVFSERSELVLDFNIALTGFDIQSFSIGSVLRGNLPITPVSTAHVSATVDVCQRNAAASVYPAADGFLRIRPAQADAATPLDNTLATTVYPAGPFANAFLFQVLDSLDVTSDSRICSPFDNTITNPIHGYITIDHANYCNLSNPSDPAYYNFDAIGNENNLWGDYIFTSGDGLGTMGFPMVAIESDATLQDPGPAIAVRTFYRRYYTTDVLCHGGNCAQFAATNAWNEGVGDQREPLGLKYAARWFDSPPNVTSFFNVWRASSGTLADLLDGGSCDTSEPTVTLVFYDEDENTVTSGVCPSPCVSPTFNFPLETQRSSITAFSHPAWPAGWVSMSFVNPGTAGNNNGILDQAYVTYDFEGAGAFLSAGSPAAQLDPSACNPLGITGVNVITPVIPAVVGTGP